MAATACRLPRRVAILVSLACAGWMWLGVAAPSRAADAPAPEAKTAEKKAERKAPHVIACRTPWL
ncbi:MAG: hypothetical protein NTW19_03550, partial [Planctomycetota bacterium]|nr:hypothetical protein [Planctomycetota bacterium]